MKQQSTPKRQTSAFGPVALVNTASETILLEQIEALLLANKGFAVATLNLDHIVKMRGDAAFRDAYLRHSHIVADGNPIVWLSRLSGRPVELVPGSELIDPLSALAGRLKTPIALFGATQETLALAATRLEASHPGLQVVSQIAPPFGFDPLADSTETYLDQIRESGAKLCFLALGAPKQEMLAARAVDHLPLCGFVSIGAGLDFIAGTQTRAPRWVRKIAMEWFWRMVTNPRRLAKRYWDCIVILPGLTTTAVRQRSQNEGGSD